MTIPVVIENDTKARYVFSTGSQVLVAAARTTHFDLFNASDKKVTVTGLYIIIDLSIAVTGVGFLWEVIRTSAVGTGGTPKTSQKYNTTDPDIPLTVTARSKPTGGATGSTALMFAGIHSEETGNYAALSASVNHLQSPIVLYANQGLKLDQTTNSAAGNVNIVAVFTIE